MNLGEFWSRTRAMPDGCVLWLGAHANGYGKVSEDGRSLPAHRWIYQKLIGEVPDGLELDHLCRNRGCVNVKHLEAVSHRENLKRSPLHGLPKSEEQRQKCAHRNPTGSPMTRQRKWQIKQRANGRCMICGAEAVNANHCEKHRVMSNAITVKSHRKRREAENAGAR